MDLPKPDVGFTLLWHLLGGAVPFMGVWHCHVRPYIYPTASSAFLSLCPLSFSLRDSALLRLCRWRGLCMLKLTLIYLLLFLYSFWTHTKVESITPILNPNHTRVWLRCTVLERTSQNGDFTVMHSQVSSLSVGNVCAFFLILRHFLLAFCHWCLLCFSLLVAPSSSFLPFLHVP